VKAPVSTPNVLVFGWHPGPAGHGDRGRDTRAEAAADAVETLEVLIDLILKCFPAMSASTRPWWPALTPVGRSRHSRACAGSNRYVMTGGCWGKARPMGTTPGVVKHVVLDGPVAFAPARITKT